ncbi:MAG: thiamine diphosphokinase [Tissierellales bacterium]|nr:thiamine diphosphokinase [Tissierellales bacterium]
MNILIVSGGKKISKEKLKELCKANDLIVAADSGADQLIDLNILPDYLIGDLDSISLKSKKLLETKDINVIIYPKEKDKSDTEIALDLVIKKSPTTITFTSVIGTRMDHSLSNIFLLKKLYDLNIDSQIIDDNNLIKILNNEQSIINPSDFDYVSIVPISLDGIIISIKGFHYNLDKQFVKFGSSMCISNEMNSNEGYITKHSGEGLLILSKD